MQATLIKYGLVALALALVVGGAYRWAWDRGYDQRTAEWEKAVAEAKGKRDAELTVARLRGDALSKTLAEKERQLSNLSKEYLTYANAITGNCPASFGVLVQSAATSAGLPAPAGPPPDPSATVAASLVATNVAENYTRAWACIAQLNALIDWHATAKEALK